MASQVSERQGLVDWIRQMPDNTSAHGLIALAESYAAGAVILHQSRSVGKTRMVHKHPDLAMAVHAVEAATKAVCLSSGMPADELKKISHNLEKSLAKAVALSGQPGPDVLALDITILSELHQKRSFFYHAIAPLNLETAPVVECALQVVNWAIPIVLPGSPRRVRTAP